MAADLQEFCEVRWHASRFTRVVMDCFVRLPCMQSVALPPEAAADDDSKTNL